MSLRRACCVILLVLGARAAPLTDLGPPTVGIVILSRRPPPEHFLSHFQREVEHLFRPARLTLRWEVGSARRGGTYNRIVVVELRGSCSPERIGGPDVPEVVPGAPLGWTYVMDGEVIPHSVLDCDRVAATVAEARTRMSGPAHVRNLFGRLAARVLVHEMMHVLLQTTEHDAADFTRSPIRPADLQTAPRLRRAQVLALERALRVQPGVALADGR